MPKHMLRCSVKCPYYKCEERHEIFCKGPREAMAIHVAFAVPTEKKLWLNTFCKEKYEDCLVCRALMKVEKI